MSFYLLPRIRHSAPTWSDEKVQILTADCAESLEDWINVMLASSVMYVLAFSEPLVVGTYVEDPWCSVLVYQERTSPNEESS